MKKLSYAMFFMYSQVCIANIELANTKINSGQISIRKDEILLSVSYLGGCGDHYFSLRNDMCELTSPMTCQFSLQHLSNDVCNVWTHEMITLPISLYFHNQNYSEARISINAQYNSGAVVNLPTLNEKEVSVLSANLSSDKKDLVLGVRYQGGCADHRFGLKIDTCQTTIPMSCNVKLVHYSDDNCIDVAEEYVSFPISQYFKTPNNLYQNAMITFMGANSTINIRLP